MTAQGYNFDRKSIGRVAKVIRRIEATPDGFNVPPQRRRPPATARSVPYLISATFDVDTQILTATLKNDVFQVQGNYGNGELTTPQNRNLLKLDYNYDIHEPIIYEFDFSAAVGSFEVEFLKISCQYNAGDLGVLWRTTDDITGNDAFTIDHQFDGTPTVVTFATTGGNHLFSIKWNGGTGTLEYNMGRPLLGSMPVVSRYPAYLGGISYFGPCLTTSLRDFDGEVVYGQGKNFDDFVIVAWDLLSQSTPQTTIHVDSFANRGLYGQIQIIGYVKTDDSFKVKQIVQLAGGLRIFGKESINFSQLQQLDGDKSEMIFRDGVLISGAINQTP